MKSKPEPKRKKIRILAVGDLHGDTKQATKLAELAKKEKVDYVILCGDLTFAEQSVDYLIGPFVKRGEKVLFIPGNHESLATANFLEKIYQPYAMNLHGKAIKTGSVGIFGAGGATIGLFHMPEKKIYKTLGEGFDKVKNMKKKLMITHVHPSDTLMSKLSNFVSGSTGVKEAVEKFKPDILLCSHVHEAEGIEEKLGKTRIINVGRKGRIIEI